MTSLSTEVWYLFCGFPTFGAAWVHLNIQGPFCLFLLWLLFPCNLFFVGRRKDFYWIGKGSICTRPSFWASLTCCLQYYRKHLLVLQNIYVYGVLRTWLLPGLRISFGQVSVLQLSSVLGVSSALPESSALRKVFSMYFLLSELQGFPF